MQITNIRTQKGDITIDPTDIKKIGYCDIFYNKVNNLLVG